MRQITYLLFLCLFFSANVFAQVGINTDNSDPDASAMLDVKSTNKGMLVPRMSSSQRTMISNAAIGLLVFDTDTETFWFNDSHGWMELVSGNVSTLTDADADTKVDVTEMGDEDRISFLVGGTERLLMQNSLFRINGTLNINNAFSFPNTDGTNGQVLTTNGLGTLSWATLLNGTSTFIRNGAINAIVGGSTVNYTTDDFIFGSAQTDDAGNANHDSRFFFDKSKGAFRAGIETGDRWDEANRGVGSVAMGNGNTAAGENAVAMGYESGAMSIGAVSLGYQNGALGDVTVAIGNRNVVDTDTAFAIGSYNFADKDYALAVGTENEAQEEASTAIGFANLATAIGASAFGEFNEANGASSLALGSGAIANGTASVAIGSSNAEGMGSLAVGIENTANGDFSQTLGSNLTASSAFETVFGYFNTSYTPTSTSNPSSTDRLFVIGNGMGPINSQRSDALIILKNGATRINGPLTLGISGNNLTSYTLPNLRGSNGQILQTNGSGVVNWADAPASSSIMNSIGTTKVDASANSLISFEAGGQEILTMQRGGFEFRNTNGSIYLGGDAGKSDNYSGLGDNIGIGSSALSDNRTGSYNTAIGSNANVGSDNLSNATAIGANALVSQSNALILGNNANVGIGTSTPDEKLHVVGNVKIEDGNAQAGYILTSDANGVGTWQQNTGANGIQNIIQDADNDTKIQVEESADEDAIRFDLAGTELMRLDSGRIEILNNNKNIFIGNDAGFDFNANHDAFNVMIGEVAGSGLTSGTFNTGVGSFALHNNTQGVLNTAFGISAALENTTGDSNTAIGSHAFNNNKTGSFNVAIGAQALYTNLSTINNIKENVAIGWRAGFNMTGNGNILIGRSAGSDQNGDNRLIIENSGSTTPLIYGEFDNNLVRINGDLEVTGSLPTNTLVADSDNDTKIQVEENTDEDIIRFDVGGTESFRMVDSRLEVVDPLGSIYIGLKSGSNRDDEQSLFNVMLGHEAGMSITRGSSNVGVGTFSLNSNQTGGLNTALGAFAARLNTSGNNNVSVGTRASFSNETGNNNVAIGTDAGQNSTGSNNIFLGYQAGQNEMGNHKLYIENSSSSTPLIYGEFDNDLIRINGELNIKNEYSLPTADGTNGQILTTDGAGNTSWSDAGSVPVGTIWMYHGNTAPAGWLICDGTTFNATTYPALMTLLGDNRLPDFRARFPMGTGDNGNLGSPDASLGNKGGQNSHQLKLNEMPPHTHSISYREGSESGSSSNNYSDLGNTGNTVQTGSAGGNNTTDEATPFNITNPYYVVNFIIKAN